MAVVLAIRRSFWQRRTISQWHAYLSTQSITKSYQNAGIYSILSDKERTILDDQRSLIHRARQLSQNVGISNARIGERSILDESVFTIVVAGEFNSGKSTLINALVGSKLLDVGHLPTTDSITILSHNTASEDENAPQQPPLTPGVMHLTVNLPLLRDMNIVDTPGTNALTNHTSRTLNLLPKADCILFVTSADRPFPESERRIIEGIQQYRKSITIVINKMDIIEASGGDHGYKEKQKLINFVADHASDLLGANPTILAVSARDALAAKLTSPQHEHELAAIWKRSNFKTLETFLRDTLTTETRIKAKLLNPIGVAEGWINECQARLAKESRDLEADRVTLNLLSSQLDRWRMDIRMDMKRARNEIRERLDQEGRRARIVSKRLHKVTDFYRATLIDPLLLAREWKSTQSIAYKHETLEAELQHLIQETADAIALRGRAQGQAVIEFLGQRPSLRNRSLVSSVMTASKFEETRDNLRENMALAMQRFIFDEDIEGEQRLFLESLQFLARISATLFSVAIMSVGSGALQAVDIVAGSSVGAALAVSGAFVLTNRRPALTQNYERKWTERNQKFQEALCRIMEEELDRLERHIKNGVTPYTRHVQADEERLHSLSTECQDLLSESHRLRKLINDVGTK